MTSITVEVRVIFIVTSIKVLSPVPREPSTTTLWMRVALILVRSDHDSAFRKLAATRGASMKQTYRWVRAHSHGRQFGPARTTFCNVAASDCLCADVISGVRPKCTVNKYALSEAPLGPQVYVCVLACCQSTPFATPVQSFASLASRLLS